MAASGALVRALALLLATAPLSAVPSAQAATPTEPLGETKQLVSESPTGKRANDGSADPEVSTDGSVVVYNSGATNLTDDPQNSNSDVFLWNRASDTTILISRGLSGAASNSYSYSAAVSADGSYVAFGSAASNLVPGDTNGDEDIFLYEVATGEVSLVSAAPDGTPADRDSFLPDISNDGRYVVFASDARNLIAGDTNKKTDVFRVDRSTGVTTRVSVGPDGEELIGGSNYPAISGDGDFIAVQSAAQFAGLGDFNDNLDIILYPRTRGAVELLSLTPEGVAGNGDSTKPTLSDDGEVVAFESRAPDLVSDDGESGNDIFVRDRVEQATTLINRTRGGKVARGRSSMPSISGDGAHVTYTSTADDLLPGGPESSIYCAYAFDRRTGVTTYVDHRPNGKSTKSGGDNASINYDGTYVSYSSEFERQRYDLVYLRTETP